MKDKDFLTWQSRIVELNETQVKSLLQRLKHLGKLPKEEAESGPVDDWLFTGICTVLKSKGLISPASIAALRRTQSYQSYLRIRLQLHDQLDLLVPNKTHPERMSLALLVGNALLERLRIMRIPITAGTVLKHTPYVMEALEMSFPGYIAANLFHLVVRVSANPQLKEKLPYVKSEICKITK